MNTGIKTNSKEVVYNIHTSHNRPWWIDHCWHNEPTGAKTHINSLYIDTEACTSTKRLVCTTMECTRRSCAWYLEATEPTLLNYSFALVLGLHVLKYSHVHRAYNHISSIQHTASSTHARAHTHTHRLLYGNWDTERISVAFRYAAAFRQCEKTSQEHVSNSFLKSSLPGSPYLLGTCLWMRVRVPARTLYTYTSIDMKKIFAGQRST